MNIRVSSIFGLVVFLAHTILVLAENFYHNTDSSCATCDWVFLRPQASINDLESDTNENFRSEVYLFDQWEIRASVERGCDWCKVLLHYFLTAYSEIEQPGCPLEETEWYVILGWHRPWHSDEASRGWEIHNYHPYMHVGSQRVNTIIVEVKTATGKLKILLIKYFEFLLLLSPFQHVAPSTFLDSLRKYTHR